MRWSASTPATRPFTRGGIAKPATPHTRPHAFATNASGVSVGWVQRPQILYAGTVWSQDREVILDGRDKPELTWANGINDSNVVLGYQEGLEGAWSRARGGPTASAGP